MIQVAIVKRRLKEGKMYDDFRKAWYHTTGFGTNNQMLTVLNAANPREITYQPPTVRGKITDMNEVAKDFEEGAKLLAQVRFSLGKRVIDCIFLLLSNNLRPVQQKAD